MGLTFLTPLMLAGAALVAAPIILHLVMRQEPKHLVFPALRFIRQRNDVNKRRLKLRHLILLALRCAAILFFALALARPSLQSAGFLGDREAPVAAALVFDTSPRMQYRLQNQTRIEEAQEAAARVLAQLPADSDVAVIDSKRLAPAFSIDMAVARQRVERLSVTAAAQPLTEACEDALRLVSESSKARKEIYVFTDLTHAAWSDEGTKRLGEQLAKHTDVAFYVIDVGVADPRNVSLGDLRLSAETLAKNSSLRIETDVASDQVAEQRAVSVAMIDPSGQPQSRAQSVVQTQPGQAQPIEFQIGGLDEGLHQGVVRLAGDDSLPMDDVRYFTIEVRPPWKVLIAAPKASMGPAGVLAEALAPSQFRRTGQARFVCDVVPIENLANQGLDDYAAVCLVDPPPLADALWQSLIGFAERGGGVAIWLGKNAQQRGRSLDEFNTPAAQKLLPGKLARVWRRQDAFLAPQDYQHPLLAKFRSIAGGIPWDAYTIWSHWQLTDLAEGANTIIPYSNGQPALIESSLGKGRILVFTTPVADNATDPDLWNALVIGSQPWPFVMLTNESLLYLVGSGEERLNYMAGDTVTLEVPDTQRQLIFSLRTPDNEDYPQSVDQKTGMVTISSTSTVGNYLLRAGGIESGARLGFSVNIPASATNLTRISADEFETLLGDGRVRLSRGREEIERDVNLGRTGSELFPLLIVLVAIVLGLEHLLANKFYRRDPQSENPTRPSLAALVTDEPKKERETAAAV